MNTIIVRYLYRLRLGQMQTFKNMSILPLFTSINGGPDYITLQGALADKLITITELDQSGSVPELKVVNDSDQQVLLLDGEELTGAKQNRVLNTTILFRKRSATTIPVSCTEQGRWAYTSAEFAYSGAMMAYRSRSSKSASVSSSLRAGQGHSSDQGRVWAEISTLHAQAGTSSPTGAMRDIYSAKTETLNAYVNAFDPVPQQCGCMVYINGQVIGFDIVSREVAYKTIHPQLVQSYALDALLQNEEEAVQPSENAAVTFLKNTLRCKEEQFEAVSQGVDYRLTGAGITGSALVCDEYVIHMSFFKMDQNESVTSLSSYSRRRMLRRPPRS